MLSSKRMASKPLPARRPSAPRVPVPKSSLPSLIWPSWLRSITSRPSVAEAQPTLCTVPVALRSKCTPSAAAVVRTPLPSRSSTMGVAAKRASSCAFDIALMSSASKAPIWSLVIAAMSAVSRPTICVVVIAMICAGVSAATAWLLSAAICWLPSVAMCSGAKATTWSGSSAWMAAVVSARRSCVSRP